MKAVILSGLMIFGTLGLAPQNSHADDSIVDGCLIGAVAGTAIGILASQFTHGRVKSGYRDKGAIIGTGIGCGSDAAYDDDIERERVTYIDRYGRKRVRIENSYRTDGFGKYPDYRYRSRTTVREVGRTSRTISFDGDLDNIN